MLHRIVDGHDFSPSVDRIGRSLIKDSWPSVWREAQRLHNSYLKCLEPEVNPEKQAAFFGSVRKGFGTSKKKAFADAYP
jgi:hypothetical protein